MTTSDEITERDKTLSEFNEAKFGVLRQHDTWNLCKRHRRNGDILSWKWELDCAWDELQPKVEHTKTDPETTAIRKKATIIELTIKVAEKHQDKTKLYEALRNKERFLKWVQENIGMGGKYSDGSDYSMEE